jgi:predicted enzyme related to lactoylglutathione lyase
MVRLDGGMRNPSVEGCALHLAAAGECSAQRHFVRVLQVAADRKSAGESRNANASAQSVREVRGRRLARHVRVRREHDLLHAVPLDAPDQLVDAQVLGIDAVDRGERAAEDVVQATKLARSLDRDQVDRLLDDADQRVVAAGVETDRTALLLGEVPALVAEADALLHVLDRGGERECLVLGTLQEVEREAVRSASPDAGEARKLRDKVLDGGAEHLSYSADMPRISEVALFTDDVPRLADFYEQLLGRPADNRSDSHASFDIGGTTLFIHVKGDAPDHEGAPNADHVAFALDQDGAAERARVAGAHVVGPKDYYWGRSAYLRDPDGRAVELTSN